MKIEYPKQYEAFLVEKLLGEALFQKYMAGKLGKNILTPYVEALSTLSESYIQETFLPRKKIDQKRESIAYAMYFGQLTTAKLLALLPYLDSHYDSESILDFGCGPGTSVLSLESTLKIHSYTGIDSSEEMLRTAKKLFPQYTFQRNIPHKKYSLIILSNVLAEISEQYSFIHNLIQYLLPRGRILIIEPGTKAFTQKLMKLRDSLLADEIFPIFPCPHVNLCPMRTHPQDWCHTELKWNRPQLIEELDTLLGFNKHKLKFSTLILRTTEPHIDQSQRIVSPLIKTKRGVIATVCSRDFYGEKILNTQQAKSQEWFSLLSDA